MNAQLQQVQRGIAEARERFMALAPRERWIVGVGGIALLLTILFLAVWEPAIKARQDRAAALESARAIATRLEQAAAQVRAAPGAALAGRGVSLLAAVDQAIKQSGLGKAPTRMEPEGDREVNIWFEAVPFDGVVPWLAMLQDRYGIGVQTLDVEPESAGLVNLRLSLVRS